MGLRNSIIYGVIASAIVLCADTHAEAQLTLLTEENPPFQFTIESEGGQTIVSGLCVAIIEELMRTSNIDYQLKVYPWKRAFHLARTTENHAVFSTIKTAEREAQFKWVGPIFRSEWIVMA